MTQCARLAAYAWHPTAELPQAAHAGLGLVARPTKLMKHPLGLS
jgi:hypothetical protein